MLPDNLLNRFPILEGFVVPKSQDGVTLSCKKLRARLIGFDLFSVLAAVQFQDQFALQADEIKNVRPHRHLPAKLEAAELAITNFVPNESLGICHVLSEVSRSFN